MHTSATVDDDGCDFNKNTIAAKQANLMQRLIESSKAKDTPQAATADDTKNEAPVEELKKDKAELAEVKPVESTPLVDTVQMELELLSFGASADNISSKEEVKVEVQDNPDMGYHKDLNQVFSGHTNPTQDDVRRISSQKYTTDQLIDVFNTAPNRVSNLTNSTKETAAAKAVDPFADFLSLSGSSSQKTSNNNLLQK